MKVNELRRKMRCAAAGLMPRLVAIVPERLGRRLGAGAGWFAHWTIARDRARARRNLSLVHPDWSEARVRREAIRVFEEIGRNAYDYVRYPGLSPRTRADLVRVIGVEHLERACAGGRGVVLITGHLGAFELLAAHVCERGLRFRALARPLREPRLDAVLGRHRERLGFSTISTRGPLREAVRHLRGGGVLGVVMDQRVRRGGSVVRFLGRPTRMTDGPARLARSTGALVLPAGIVRLPDHRHRIRFLPPLEAGPAGTPVREDTQRLATALEGLIADAPEQWMWIHPRWEEDLSAHPVPAGATGDVRA